MIITCKKKVPLHWIAFAIMPWAAFGRMTDDDVRAIYRYLRSLDPVEHDPGPIVTKKAS